MSSTPLGPSTPRSSRPSRPAQADGDVLVVDARARGAHRAFAEPLNLRPKQRVRRALTLLLMTAVAPGSAQYVAGERRLGRTALRIWGALLAAVVLLLLLALVKRGWAVHFIAQSWVLLLLAVILFIAAAGWVYLLFDAARLGRFGLTPSRARTGLAALTAFLMVLTAGPLVWAGTNVLAGRKALDAFSVGTISREPVDGRYNVLLLGGDSGASRIGTRPDTIMLASIDADTGRTVMFGFARDTENITFREGSLMRQLMPQGWNCGDKCLLNGLYTWAMDNKAKFPPDVKDPGVLATTQAVEALSGLDIQYYALVDLKGFTRIIDALGGLTIDVKKATPIGGGTSRIKRYIQPGVQHLNGYESLWYARSRAGSTNYERMARQRCVLTAMVNQFNPQTVIFKFSSVAEASGGVLKTDIPGGDFPAFAELALKVRSQKITSVNFVPPLINPWKYDPAVITTTVRDKIEASKKDTSAPKKKTAPTSAPKASLAPADSVRPNASATSGPSADAAADDLDAVCAPA